MGKRIYSLVAAAVLGIIGTCAAEADTNEWERTYYLMADVSPVFFSLGKATTRHWNYYYEADAVQQLSAYGYLLVGWWAVSDIDTPNSRKHRAAMYESDPYAFYGYRLKFAEDWALNQRLGMIWVTFPGYRNEYRGVSDHSYREWTYNASVENPYVTPAVEIRVVDRLGTYLRTSLSHSFTVWEGLSLRPYLNAYGGSRRWNDARFGALREDRRIGNSLVSVRYGARATYKFDTGIAFSFDISGYDCVDPDGRAQVRERHRRGNSQRTDQLIVSLGVSYEW